MNSVGTICKHCGELIEPTGGKLYLWTHVDPNQQKCIVAAPANSVPPKTAKHTSGNWRCAFDADGDWAIFGPDNVLIAVTSGEPYRTLDEDAANAHLIAAASELLRAVYHAIPGYITTGEASYDRLLALCRAYKKATGSRHPADRWTEQ